MNEKKFVFVSMREDSFYSGSEIRAGVDQVIKWIFSLNLFPVLLPNINLLNNYLRLKILIYLE